MELFKDKREALERLDQLLQEEEDSQEEEAACEESFDEDFDGDLEEAPAEEPVIYRNYSNAYGRIYNSDVSDRDLEEFSEEVYEPKKRSDTLVLSAIALALAAAIMGVLAWWVARYL